MGCSTGNSNRTHTEENYHSGNKQTKGFKVSSTKCLENYEKLVTTKAFSKEGLKFLKLAEEASKEKEVEFKNLLITSNTYFDLLSSLNQNQNLESFVMNNVEVEGIYIYIINVLGHSDILIHLAKTLSGKKRKME